MVKKSRLLIVALILAFSASLMQPYKVQAASILVTVTSDGYDENQGNFCTLRMAIVAANENRPVGRCAAGSATEVDVITFNQSGLYFLNRFGDDPAVCSDADKAADKCYRGDLDITQSVIILGPASGGVTIEASQIKNRIFHINTTGSVTLRNLTIKAGFAPNEENGVLSGLGGGIYNQKGTLSVENSVIEGNNADGGGGIHTQVNATTRISGSVIFNNSANAGAGIMNNGKLDVRDSLIYKNRATAAGGGFNNNDNRAAAVFTNVTLASNDAGGGGSALFNQASVQIINSTISANTGSKALYISGPGTIINTILVGNASGNCFFNGNGIPFFTQGGNLLDKPDCPFPPDPQRTIDKPDQQSSKLVSEIIGTMNYETNKQTMYVLPAGSPAIDGGTNNGCADNDQRGLFYKRPRTASNVCDIGSYEVGATHVVMQVYLPITRR
jgi:hypothetical protein